MHRRQYIPGSHIKRNRSVLAEENKVLRSKLSETQGYLGIASEANRLLRSRTLKSRAKALWQKIVRLFRRPFPVPDSFAGRRAA